MNSIGILTSGGDAPGMNAAIRAVVRTAITNGLKVFGIHHGYAGLIRGEIEELNSHSVSNIIQRGGTILKTARCEELRTKEGRESAYEQLMQFGIDALLVLGGDGTFRGALALGHESGFPIIGIPCTIDNDLFGTDSTIGYDTAINTVMHAVDKIRDTASAHDRLFFVEVMGRDAGFIALRSGISVGAEAILIPETTTYIEQLIDKLNKEWKRKKSSLIIIVAEGDDSGGAFTIAQKVKKRFNHYDTRVSVLGHIQRGGSPSAFDRVLASQLGYEATTALMKGHRGAMAGIINKQMILTPFEKSVKHNRHINTALLHLADLLSSV